MKPQDGEFSVHIILNFSSINTDFVKQSSQIPQIFLSISSAKLNIRPKYINMSVIKLSQEFTSPVDAARLFKALIIDSHNLIPKLMPQAIKSIEIIQGDGGAGTIKQINFAEGIELSTPQLRSSSNITFC